MTYGPTAAGVRSKDELAIPLQNDRVLFMRLGGRRIEYQADVLVDVGAT